MLLCGKTSAHSVMTCRIDPSWWTHSSQCSTTGITGMYYTVYSTMHIKKPLLLIGGSGFLFLLSE